jgi:hypothetical protein
MPMPDTHCSECGLHIDQDGHMPDCSHSEPVRADQVEKLDLRDDYQRLREERKRNAERIRIRQQVIKNAGGANPDLVADLEARLRRADKRVGEQ